MKKQLLVTVIALVPAMGFAKVSDFNAMIADNMKEQNQLHSEVKNNVIEAYEYLGYYYVVQKDNAKATEYFNMLKEIDPTNKKATDFFKKPAGGK